MKPLIQKLTKTFSPSGHETASQPGGGGTDAGAIHKTRAGIPSVSVSVPHRYSHTAVSIARLDDWKNTLALLHAALTRLMPDLLAGVRA